MLKQKSEAYRPKIRSLEAKAKKKEVIRRKLVTTARHLAATAEDKEVTRRKLATTARHLAATAEDKEVTRRKLATTARQLAATAKEKEVIRRKLAVTAKKLAAAAKVNIELKVLDKLKDDLLSFTAHELKTPLIPIKAQAQILLSGIYGKLNGKQKAAIEMLLRNEEHLNKMISDLLDISRIRSNRFNIILQRTTWSEIVAAAVKDMRLLYEKKHVTLTLLPVPKLPNTLADKSRLGQVMRNLLDNALKFTPKGGRVMVEVNKVKRNIVVTVKDTGIGIEPEFMGKLFTPFFQVDSSLDRKHGGSGLGLAISRGIIKAHGGRITAASGGQGQGCTFRVSVPIKVTNQLSKSL